MHVLIYGGTGVQASPLVQQLIDRGHVPHVLTRSTASLKSSRLSGAQYVQAELADPASLVAATRGMDAVSFLIPAFVSDPSKRMVYADNAMRAAAEANVKIVVWNTSGRLPEENEMGSEGNPLLSIWNAIRRHDVPLTIIAPTKYAENLLAPWNVEAVRTLNRVPYPVLPERKVGWISAADVSALVLEALVRPELAGSVFRVSGIEAINGRQLAEAFSAVLGRSLSYYAMSEDEMAKALESAFGPGAGAATAQRYGREQRDPDPPKLYYDMTPVLRELPARMTTIREWIAGNAAAFS